MRPDNRLTRSRVEDSSDPTVNEVRVECGQLFMIYQGRAGRLMLPTRDFIKITKLHDRNLLLFRDASRTDYQRGLSVQIPSMAHFVEWQKKQREFHFPHVQTTYCVGTAAGGYAAIASGHLLKVSVVWAFSPLTLVEDPLGPDDEISKQCRDLRKLLETGNGTTEYRIFYNENCEEDQVGAERLGECPGVKLFPQPGDTHRVVLTMAGAGLLENLMVPFEPVQQTDSKS